MALKLVIVLALQTTLLGLAACDSENGGTENEAFLENFEVIWQTVNDRCFDPDFGGLDWDEVHDRYRPLIAAGESGEDFFRIMNQMLFELDVSHLGVAPADELTPGLSDEGSIGIDVRLLDDEAVITSVESGSPGGEAGLQPGFVVQTIDGASTEEVRSSAFLTPPFNDRSESLSILNGIMGRLNGSPGTTVSVAYLDERGEAHEQSIVRARRSGEEVAVGGGLPPFFIDFEATRLDGNIGYMRFNAFIPPVDERFADAIEWMGDAAGLIIDIRGNDGGVWPVRKLLAERLVGERVLAWTYRSRDGSRDVYLDPAETVHEGPVVVLIDGASESSAEEFAGALQAIDRAVIVGERSPGRVLVADFMELPNGTILIYPIEQTITADGTVLEGHGVVPDIPVGLDRELLLQGVDSQLEAAIEYIESAASQAE
jgi:carboxyl-terminal processing protease